MAQHFGGNAEVKGDPIWIIAARNNEKEVKRTYRIHDYSAVVVKNF